jgi:hypothetical protein
MQPMTLRRPFKAARIALCFVAFALPASAQANGLVLIGPQIGSSLLFLLSSGSHCVVFTYDPNGNRTSQTNSTVGSGPALWGSDKFGCFAWSQ